MSNVQLNPHPSIVSLVSAREKPKKQKGEIQIKKVRKYQLFFFKKQ